MKTILMAAALAAYAAPAWSDTVLKLSETAHVMVHPDELVASLRADSTGSSAAEAQAMVNTAIARALEQVKQAPGITAATGFYQVWQVTKPATQWHAGQSVTLKTGDGPALLKLVGTLQGSGLALEGLSWQLAPATARAAQSQATREALSRLRARAEEAAGILGLRFVSFREVRLDGTRPSPQPAPRMFAMAASAAPAAPPPSAEAQDADIQASVDADAVLVPAQP